MAKGEVRKGKWGILGDGFFAQLSASGDPPGPLYHNANIKLQQGMVELALVYRIIDDRRGFVDIYAGARYNYFGIDVDASIDEAGVQEVSNDAARRIFVAVGTRVQDAVNAEVQKLRTELGNEEAILEDDARNRLARDLESDLQARLRRELATSRSLREAVRTEDVRRMAKGVRSEHRAFLDAVLDERLAQARTRLDAREARQLDSNHTRQGFEHDAAPLQPARTVLHEGMAAERARAGEVNSDPIHAMKTKHTTGLIVVVLLFIVGVITGLAQERVSSPASEPATR
jgi:hypothetical protein